MIGLANYQAVFSAFRATRGRTDNLPTHETCHSGHRNQYYDWSGQLSSGFFAPSAEAELQMPFWRSLPRFFRRLSHWVRDT
jgi:hypothetical protein